MASSLNLQRNSEVFFSTVDLYNGGAVTSMTPANTWKLEVLAGFAATSSSAVQDITSMESGLNPDRSQQHYNTAINPVDWNLQVYMRPTGAISTTAGAGSSSTSNVKPIADWFMWQALISNTKVASAATEQSVWENGGKLRSVNVASTANSSSSRSNFASAQENHLYMSLDNVIYQVTNAIVDQATVDAGIQAIATTTWTGKGTFIRELIGTVRDNAASVFGAVLANGTYYAGNANTYAMTAAASYQPFATMNVASALSTNSFIKNRLSSIVFTHTPQGGTANTYTFPVTALTLDYANNTQYLTPEELANLNAPIGQFAGTRAVKGTATMYLRSGDSDSAQFLRNITTDSRTNFAQFASANLQIGGNTTPYVQFTLPAVQFDFPQLAVNDIISVSVNFVAQEPFATQGTGGELTITAVK